MDIHQKIPSVLVYKIMGLVAMPFSDELFVLFVVENICQKWHAGRNALMRESGWGRPDASKEEFSPVRILRRIRNERALRAYME